MSPQDMATITAFTLGGISCALGLTAEVSLLQTVSTIACRKADKLKARALKSLLAAAVTGATASKGFKQPGFSLTP